MSSATRLLTFSDNEDELLDLASASHAENLPPPRRQNSHARKQSPGHIPRPRNSFILYRTWLVNNKCLSNVEKDDRNISQIAGQLWRELPQDEKAGWQRQAQKELLDHKIAYPDYRYSPVQRRSHPVQKRKTKIPTEKDVQKREFIVGALRSGIEGKELEKRREEEGASLVAQSNVPDLRQREKALSKRKSNCKRTPSTNSTVPRPRPRRRLVTPDSDSDSDDFYALSAPPSRRRSTRSSRTQAHPYPQLRYPSPSVADSYIADLRYPSPTTPSLSQYRQLCTPEPDEMLRTEVVKEEVASLLGLKTSTTLENADGKIFNHPLPIPEEYKMATYSAPYFDSSWPAFIASPSTTTTPPIFHSSELDCQSPFSDDIPFLNTETITSSPIDGGGSLTSFDSFHTQSFLPLPQAVPTLSSFTASPSPPYPSFVGMAMELPQSSVEADVFSDFVCITTASIDDDCESPWSYPASSTDDGTDALINGMRGDVCLPVMETGESETELYLPLSSICPP